MKQKKVEILAVRHANTNKVADGQSDATRELTSKGFGQAALLQSLIAKEQFDFALVSSALRTRQTFAAITAGMSIGSSIHFLPEFYLPQDPEVYRQLDVMFNKLGYAPLAEYRKHEYADALEQYAETAEDAIRQALPWNLRGDSTGKVLMVGHAVCLNAILAYWAKGLSFSPAIDTILNVSLGECEALRLILSQDDETEEFDLTVEHITLPLQ